jgi:hypothetical protein
MTRDGLAGWFVVALFAVVYATYPASQPWIAACEFIACGALFSAVASLQRENDELRRRR